MNCSTLFSAFIFKTPNLVGSSTLNDPIKELEQFIEALIKLFKSTSNNRSPFIQ